MAVMAGASFFDPDRLSRGPVPCLRKLPLGRSITGDDTSIIARLVGCDEFLQGCKETCFSKNASADVPYKLVMVMQHVEDQARTSLFTGWHPTPLPFSKGIDLLVHCFLT